MSLNFPPELRISPQDWARTPPAVQALVITLWEEVQTLRAEEAALREQLGQTGTSIDNSILNLPYEDKLAALTFSLGGGVSIVGSEHFLVDLRLRYNAILGELRPLEDWGLEKSFPMQALDVAVGFKYFW